MIRDGIRVCPDCGGVLVGYDHVFRTVKTKNGKKSRVRIFRFQCKSCGKVHRELPEDILPYKQYEKEIVEGVREGLISSEVLGFEDYPSESTMDRWRIAK